MSLAPSMDFGIRGHEGKPYDVNTVCATPGCGQPSAHCHHMWSRSFLRGQPYEWVQLPDGVVIGNRVGLCAQHHDDVTSPVGGHRARLFWEGGVMHWEEVDPSVVLTTHPPQNKWVRVGPLVVQPPVRSGNVIVESGPTRDILVGAHVHDGEVVCPSCGAVRGGGETVSKAKQKLPPRPVKEWVVACPDDAEIGSDILDGWVDDFSIPLGFSDKSSRLRRYHVLTVALAWVNIHREEFIADLAEAAERRLADV